MEFISEKEVAAKWRISLKQVDALCNKNRISNVVMAGNTRKIPTDAEKSVDVRSTRYNKSDGIEHIDLAEFVEQINKRDTKMIVNIYE